MTVLHETAETDDVILGRQEHWLPLAYYGWNEIQLDGLTVDVADEERPVTLNEEMDRRIGSATAGSQRAWFINDFWVRGPHGFTQEAALIRRMLRTMWSPHIERPYNCMTPELLSRDTNGTIPRRGEAAKEHLRICRRTTWIDSGFHCMIRRWWRHRAREWESAHGCRSQAPELRAPSDLWHA